MHSIYLTHPSIQPIHPSMHPIHLTHPSIQPIHPSIHSHDPSVCKFLHTPNPSANPAVCVCVYSCRRPWTSCRRPRLPSRSARAVASWSARTWRRSSPWQPRPSTTRTATTTSSGWVRSLGTLIQTTFTSLGTLVQTTFTSLGTLVQTAFTSQALSYRRRLHR